jgi:outer membrane immunogenic protein
VGGYLAIRRKPIRGFPAVSLVRALSPHQSSSNRLTAPTIWAEAFFGGGLTYNFWQAGPWVLGIAGDYSDANVSGSFSSCGAGSPLPHPCGTALQSLATVRGNVGYNLVGSWLVYATGGYAGGNVHAWDALAGGSGTKFLSGWSAGAGVQTLLTPNLALKFEYLHTDLGSAGLFNVVPGVMETVSFSGDIFRVGLDWRFGYYAPASAKQIYTK